jgi:thiamine pyrophosphate-dependent acetolactate synthase large subunit-like protein
VIRFYGAFAAPEPKDPPVTSAKGQAAAAAEKPASAAHPSLRALERPANLTGTNAPGFGSDVVADTLRALQIPYIALNPGASYRGLHDSIVNFLGNETPQMLLCLHEESAVAIAHGYAKVTGKAMAAAVHSNVGLFHATMAMFNAWCDRFPVIVLGATGPVDAAKRRPWIDWIHTARDQGAIVRNYTKWDDQPASPAAAREAIIRATWIANTAPMGPVYINLDAEMQEAKLAEPLAPIDTARFMPQANPQASAELIQQAAAMLKAAKHPVILMGRVSRSVDGWNERIALAETLNAKVISDLKIGCGFPTDHPLHAGAPASNAMVPEAIEAVKTADVILALDWVDLAGGLRAALGMEPPKAKVINVSADFHIHNGWSMDYEILPPVDLLLPTTPDDAVPSLLAALGGAKARKPAAVKAKAESYEASSGPLRVDDLAKSLKAAVGDREVTLTHLPLSWNGAVWPFRHPLDYIGSEGGGGIGARDACRSPSAETATSSWARPRSGPRCITAFRSSSWSATTARSSTTSCIRSASRASATGRSRTAGSASASRIRTSTARHWEKRRARSGSTPSSMRAIWCRPSRRPSRRSRTARLPWSMCASSPAMRRSQLRPCCAEPRRSKTRPQHRRGARKKRRKQ